MGPGSSKLGAPGLCAKKLMYLAPARQHVQEEEAVRVEYRDARVLDDLLVVHLVRAPHDELPMETPLCMHDVEEPMGVLTCQGRARFPRLVTRAACAAPRN